MTPSVFGLRHLPRARRTYLVVASCLAVCLVGAGVAWAHWAASSTAGGNGATSATSVNQGAQPTPSVSGQSVTLTWTATTRANGGAVDGYLIKRYTAVGLVLQAPTLSACFGTIAATTCTENSVPGGDWKYSVTPVYATNWTRAESTLSTTATVVVNSAPVLTASGGTTAHTENVAVVVDSGITVTDTDTANMASGTVAVGTGYTAGQDVLAFTNQNGITGSYSAPTLTLTGSATKANWQTALRSITYNNTSNAPNTSNRTINFVVNDATTNSNTAAKTVSVAAVNDGPTNTVPGAQAISSPGAKVFSTGNGNLISISDPDAASSTVQVQLVASNGTITLSGLTGLSFTVGDGTTDPTMTFTGTITNINTALAGLGFTPTAAGAASLQIITNDQGNTGTGGSLNDNDTIAITIDASAFAGALYGWGLNTNGNVGVGNTTAKNSPVQVGSATTWVEVDTGYSSSAPTETGHSCAINTGGQLWCAGQDSYGQQGNGSSPSGSITTLTRVGAASDWAHVATGNSFSCAIKTTGRLYCAGYNDGGQLGNGTTSTTPNFTEVSGSATTWKQVSSGNAATCATRTTGALYCWGSGTDYKIGNGSTSNEDTPALVTGGASGWDTVNTGRRHTCAIKTDTSLYCWGLNASGQIGNNSTTTAQTPTAVVPASGSNTFLMVATGNDSNCAIKTDRTLWCWGENADHQLGLGASTTDADQPTLVGGASQWLSVVVGLDYACGNKTDRTVWCWGDNAEGSLGMGNTTDLNVPTQVPSLTANRLYGGGTSVGTVFAIS